LSDAQRVVSLAKREPAWPAQISFIPISNPWF